uniref:DNA repair nuclease/redox regulator APEX1 n=1 Tax=Cacopsylla melanoneura TaxID=428564 RepID=A0A8D8M9Z5_9HEMI
MKPVVLAGDLNVAHECIDVALPLTNLGKSCFTREERDYFSKFLSLGFVDTYRHLYPSHRIYTYWPYYDRPSKLNGWRLDYFLISSQLVSKLSDQEIHCDVDGSDHSPQILYLNIN